MAANQKACTALSFVFVLVIGFVLGFVGGLFCEDTASKEKSVMVWCNRGTHYTPIKVIKIISKYPHAILFSIYIALKTTFQAIMTSSLQREHPCMTGFKAIGLIVGSADRHLAAIRRKGH